MTHATTLLEQALQRYADQIYRLALLLAPDTASAEAALVRAARALAAAPPDAPLEPLLLTQILASLPRERQRRSLPGWATRGDSRDPDARLLAAIARLPREQRLALAPPLAPGDAPELPEEQRRTRRDALLALAAAAGSPELPRQIADELADERCRTARAALALDDPAIHHDPQVRGHLALCDDCRGVAQRWHALAELVGEALRRSTRALRMPERVAAAMRAAAAPRRRPSLLTILTGQRARRAAIPLAVLAIIAALVWPRAEPEQAPTAAGGATPTELRGLAAAARDTLYAPPGEGAWLERYAIRWSFLDGTYAPLVGEIARDTRDGRMRAALTHEAGGGPYEFALADGRSTLWVATTRGYAESSGALLRASWPLTATLRATPEQQRAAFGEQLRSGAWAIAASYLRQAVDAPLQSWGRQRDSAGAALEVIGFQGVSPLTGLAGTPGADGQPITVLLTIRASDARLVEVRELIGPAGGDQISRTTWQLLSAERLDDRNEDDLAFSLRASYHGSAALPEQPAPIWLPDQPLTPRDQALTPLLLLERPTALELPARAPPGATSAVVTSAPIEGSNEWYLGLYYAGGGRRLSISSVPDTIGQRAQFSSEGAVEQLTVGGRPTLLRRLAAERYAAALRPPPGEPERALLLVEAYGYSRAELLALLESARPMSLAALRDQIDLFGLPHQSGAAGAALIDALAQLVAPPPAGQLRYITATRFTRQRSDIDPLGDPYHYPAYGGRPELAFEEQWVHVAAGSPLTPTSALDTQAERHWLLRDAAGRVFDRRYDTPAGGWLWRGPERSVLEMPSALSVALDQPRSTLLRLLICGAEPELAGATTSLTLREPIGDSCARPDYPRMLIQQQLPRGDVDGATLSSDGPYIADLAGQELTTRMVLRDGSVVQVETRAGDTLIESWELISDEQLGADRLPPDLSDQPPPALFDSRAPRTLPTVFGSVSLAEALQQIQTPLLTLPDPLPDAAPFDDGSWDATWFSSANGGSAEVLYGPPSFPFDDALWRGRAVQLQIRYVDRTRGTNDIAYLYQGRADQLGELLRARAVWSGSSPTEVQVDGRRVPGWQIFTSRGVWVLFEVDGTLIAFPDGETLRQAIAQMTLAQP